jgi:putative transcriptional regulator
MKQRTQQWKCVNALPENVKKIQYKGCGLDDVYIAGGYEIEKTNYGEGIVICDMDGLHRAIGENLVTQKKELAGKELRFLRKEMDLTQAKLGRFIGLSPQQIARWEKSQSVISGPADFLLRKLYLEHIQGNISLKELVEELDDTDSNATDEQVFSPSGGQWRAVA